MIAISRHLVLLLVIAFVILTLSPLAAADIPEVMNYQGRVTDSGGAPVADGTYTIRFRIYDASSGGNLEWDSGNRSVEVTNSMFEFLMGQDPQPGINLEFDESYWLLVTFDGDDQLPRSRMGSVGYAFMASGLVPGTEVIGSFTGGTGAALKATNTATSGTSYGLRGTASSTYGFGVFGTNINSTRYGTLGGPDHGVYGYGDSGVNGFLGAGTIGAGGTSSATSGWGVYGEATATIGSTYGGRFESVSNAGTGLYGYASATAGTTYGVHGKSASSSGIGVYGATTSDNGVTYGVHGESNSTTGRGVDGLADAMSGSTYGVYGRSASAAGTGVRGNAYATVGTNYGVYGQTFSGSGYGVYFVGGLAGTGTKSCVVKTSQGPTLMYCQESPENWFEDFGEGQLVNGKAHIDLDPLFLETVTVNVANPMKVFVQLRDECEGVYVKTGETGFDVVELHEGTTNTPFAYRVVAKRRGFESRRLDYCEAAETDSYLFPELRAKELEEQQE